MEVPEDKAVPTSEYGGKKYFFCSEHCKRAFDINPDKYLSPAWIPAAMQGPHKAAFEEITDGRKDKNSPIRTERIDLPIRGMTCAGWVAHIQKNLRGLPGVDKADVNFSTSTATVIFDPRATNPADFISRIREIGYDVTTVTVEIPIEGILCASCVQKIEKALLEARGVLKASVNLATGRARVEFLPSETNISELKRTIESTGYKVLEVPADVAGGGLERAVGQRE